jgi:hypothetical protein
VSSNPKYLCTECGWAAKGPCPQHPGQSLNMGKDWRPGRKGRRTRLWDNRVHGSQVPGERAETFRRWQRGYGVHPFRDRAHPPEGLALLGAADFSHDPTSLLWNDPVQVAIRAKSQKQPRPLDPPGAAGERHPGLGRPFPFNWQTLRYEDPRQERDRL